MKINSPDNQPFKCDVCGKSFKYEKTFKDHQFIHSGGFFSCCISYCFLHFLLVFLMLHFLLKYLLIYLHTGNYKFNCEVCNKGFIIKQASLTHKEKYCKTILCPLCPTRFKDRNKLERHLQRHKGEGLV